MIVDDSEEEGADGVPATTPRRLSRLRRAGQDAAAPAEDEEGVVDLCAPLAAAQPLPLVTPQRPPPAPKLEAPSTQRRSGLRERVPSSKKAPQRAALARLERLRSGVVVLGERSGGTERFLWFG